MEIIVAKNAGFCFGVKQAVDKAYSSVLKGDNKLYSYGPLIHNKQVIEKLQDLGVEAVVDLDNISDESSMIIRSHGVPLKIYNELEDKSIGIIDATCPFVRRVQKIVKDYYSKNYDIIIVGNPSHPEVIGINGWCDNSAYIIENIDKAKDIPKLKRACVVAQTTIKLELWNNVLNIINDFIEDLRPFNTICLATKERQDACKKLAKDVDIIIVIGGYHSSNTQKLYQISKKNCDHAIHIETAEDLDLKDLQGFEKIGITAGASTPEWIINDVVKKIEIKGGE